MTPEFNHMLTVAREYCSLIESARDAGDGWLRELAELLPRLHAAVAALGPASEPNGEPMRADLDARFDLFTRLRRLLGDRDGYWLEFDVVQEGQQMSGSLADDLTDIYCELKFGLTRLESEDDPEPTLDGWRHGFRVHWGQHLVDAERHLYSLSTRDETLS
jgi:hypothetical protein